MGLQQFEQRLERLVEGVFAKAFRSGLEPVEIGRRMARELDLHRTIAPRGAIVPNAFTVAVSATDRNRFASFEGELVRELAGYAAEHARAESYHFLGPLTIEFDTDPNLRTGTFLVASEVHPSPEGVPVGTLVLPDGSRVDVTSTPVVIGRLPNCQIALADPNVSRRHAEVRVEDGRPVVVDLGSTNGTKVNGAGVTSHPLEDGDTVTVGLTSIRFEAAG
jgi:hypothetical protein